MERAEIQQRVAALGTSVVDRLTEDQRKWFEEFMGAGEWGLGLEMLADWLSEEQLPITDDERAEARALAEAMGGTVDRVMGPLALCPRCA